MKNKLLLFFFISLIRTCLLQAQTLPVPSHIVVVIYENQAYPAIIGSSSAPYINALAKDSNTALFTNMFANSSSASQPNYFYLFAGSDQGVTSNTIPSNTPFTSPNLGYALNSTSHSFAEYSEGLPSAGWLGTSSGNYDRKHNPASDWQGTGTNNIPVTCNLPFSSFPTNYDSLPTVSFVVPNEADNMHSGTIASGDLWLKNNFDTYIQWAKKHNSLLIFTFDEDDGSHNNHVTSLFTGQMVKGGNYSESLSHLNVLRTIEDIYGLTKCGSTTSSTPITDVWVKTNTGISSSVQNATNIFVSPMPVKADQSLRVLINIPNDDQGKICITDFTGRIIKQENMTFYNGENDIRFDLSGINSGIYFISITGNNISATKKIVIE